MINVLWSRQARAEASKPLRATQEPLRALESTAPPTRGRHASLAASDLGWQLEQAELKRKSSVLYTRNIRVALSEGRDALERQSYDERQSYT